MNCKISYLLTISHIAVILAAYNPILLVGLPLEQKFADNPPLSGFFNEGQSKLLWELIPPQYHFSLNHIVKTDDEVQSILSWIDGLPDRL